MPTYTLGRNCTVIVGEASGGVRNVTASDSTEEITVKPFGSRNIYTYTTGYSVEAQIESIDGDFVDAMVGYCESGEAVSVSGTGFSFYGVVTSVTNSQPLDDVCTYTATVKVTNQSYR